MSNAVYRLGLHVHLPISRLSERVGHPPRFYGSTSSLPNGSPWGTFWSDVRNISELSNVFYREYPSLSSSCTPAILKLIINSRLPSSLPISILFSPNLLHSSHRAHQLHIEFFKYPELIPLISALALPVPGTASHWFSTLSYLIMQVLALISPSQRPVL